MMDPQEDNKQFASHTQDARAANEPSSVTTSSVPSAREQTYILMGRNFRHDLRSKRIWIARLVMGPLLWGLYMLSFLFQVTDDEATNTSTVELDDGTTIRLYPFERTLLIPETWHVAVNRTAVSIEAIQELQDRVPNTTFVAVDAPFDVAEYCTNRLQDTIPVKNICVDWQSETSFEIYYGGNEATLPFSPVLSGAQHVLQSIATASDYFQFQKVPSVVENESTTDAPIFLRILPGAMLVLASAVALQFILSPLSTDKFKDVVRSFQLVGVHMRTYMYSWIAYLSLQGMVTAGLMTLVSEVWNLFPQSSSGLVFLSHWLGLVHSVTMVTVLVQFAQQQETVASIPWLMAIGSLIGGSALVAWRGATSLLVVLLAMVSPFVSMVQYCSIYVNYDGLGRDQGIQWNNNLGESGLLIAFMSQLFGIALWNVGVWYASKPPSATPPDENADAAPSLDPAMFEEEPTGDVLIRVQGLGHCFPGSGRFSFGKEKVEPNTVLRDLDFTIRRGEVFGYLGHNSSGKTTSIKILSGELPLQTGQVDYHFSDFDGNATPIDAENLPTIRRRIGICPQHNDALHADISCRDYLRLFARLKGGVPTLEGQSLTEAIDAEVQRRIDDIAFTSPEDADKLIETYSGGMKRKVCIALAFLCDPEVVFLDEPSAGIDPYNRRIVWDMITQAKKGRSIILTTHFLDEADILSDRVGILKDGHLVACGSSLFLKHTVGGYKLKYDATTPLDETSFITDAERVEEETNETHSSWKMKHGCESEFPQALRTLDRMGATNVSLELTSLEHVFLETGKEDFQKDTGTEPNENEAENAEPQVTSDLLKKLWHPMAQKHDVSLAQKLLIVTKFMFSHAWKMKGSLFLNVIQPLLYLVIGFAVVGRIDGLTNVGKLATPQPIPISPGLLLGGDFNDVRFFGLGNSTEDVVVGSLNIMFTSEPSSLDDYLGDAPFLGGYSANTETIQYNERVSPFAQQVNLHMVGSLLAVANGNATDGFRISLNQIPYIREAFRSDVLLLPMMLAFGFTGIIFSVLDLLVLKGYNVVSLFRVTGITEFMVYGGVLIYKVLLTFVPFFFLSIILGNALGSVLFGNGGRWFATLITMLLYCFATAPLGALIAKKFIKSDFKTAASVFPGIYLTVLSLPYIAWNIAYQQAVGARSVLTVVGDFMSLIPPVAFQRTIGSIIQLSPRAMDENVTWAKVWNWESRVLLPILQMLLVGTLEWYYLHRITVERPPTTKLMPDEKDIGKPTQVESNFGVEKERALSNVDDTGINARELVKLFRVKPEKGAASKEPYLKAAVKGVSFAVKGNSITAVVGPNGAGKSTAMGILAAEHTAEYGALALENQTLGESDRKTDHLFDAGHVSFCPQFDALFPKKTVREHLAFYAVVRGIDTKEVAAKEHINAIVGLLGLEPHLDKLTSDISGGYKRRTCLAIAMIGYPTLMMVDECTTGLDPGARHLVWRVMRPKASDEVSLPAILLSTHYMDEAATLGDKIAMFIEGEIMCIGSLPELKEEYCNSYFVEISLKRSSTQSAASSQEGVIDLFEQAGMPVFVYESLPLRFKIQLPFQKEKYSSLEQLARIFELLQSHRENLQFFAVSQMNLEQIFINLSRGQFATAAGTSSRRLNVIQDNGSNDVEQGGMMGGAAGENAPVPESALMVPDAAASFGSSDFSL